MSKPQVLISCSAPEIADGLQKISEDCGFGALLCPDDQSWPAAAAEANAEVVLAQCDGFSASELQELKEKGVCNSGEVILISDGTPNANLDQAMMLGASFHLRHPVDEKYLRELLAEIIEELNVKAGGQQEALTSDLDQFGLLVGSSKPMRKLYRVVRKAASSNASVFIIGDSGVGKELVANTVHLSSERSDNTFVTLNCGAISPELIESELFGHLKGSFTGATSDRSGVFEQAESGTLFLDEITEMPVEQQVKLLRVLESGEYRKIGSEDTQHADVRVIAATNREPSEAIAEEKLREDLYFRLAQFPVRIPTLKERGDDIVGLARHFLAKRNAIENTKVVLTDSAIEKIEAHGWPGNVRELKHAIERAYILAESAISADEIVIEDPTDNGQGESMPSGVPLDEIEKQVILKTLEENNGGKKETAEKLGISVKTLYNKLEKYEKENDS